MKVVCNSQHELVQAIRGWYQKQMDSMNLIVEHADLNFGDGLVIKAGIDNVQAPVNVLRGGVARAVLCSLKSSQLRNQLATAHDAAFIALDKQPFSADEDDDDGDQ